MGVAKGFQPVQWISLVLAAMTAAGCCFNSSEPGCALSDSSSGDPIKAGVVTQTDSNASALFGPAQKVLVNNCASCHLSFAKYTEAEWVSAGYVTAGTPESSMVYTRLRGAGLGGTENMPPSGAISTAERNSIKNWITNIGGGSNPPTGAAARLAAALTVFGKTYSGGQSCVSCHSVTRTATSGAFGGATVPAFGTYTTSAQFVSNSLVVSGYPATSWLYRALRTHGDIGTMPKGVAESMSAPDAAIVSDWITNIDNP